MLGGLHILSSSASVATQGWYVIDNLFIAIAVFTIIMITSMKQLVLAENSTIWECLIGTALVVCCLFVVFGAVREIASYFKTYDSILKLNI